MHLVAILLSMVACLLEFCLNSSLQRLLHELNHAPKTLSPLEAL